MLIRNRKWTSIWLDGEDVKIIDQRWLPHKLEVATLDKLDDFFTAIREMWVRGAPLIGVTAAFGVARHMRIDPSDQGLEMSCNHLEKARPTAVNLQIGIDYMKRALRDLEPSLRAAAAMMAASKFRALEIEISESIGVNGAALIRAIYEEMARPVSILTHCNAGWLATVDWGTATAPIYYAAKDGIPVHVYVDETRPRNQGAQLTAWELGENGIDYELIVDNAGGHLMQHGMVDMVIVGTDRTSSNGDVCNKIGTYLKALAAKDNNIPFYVALPSTTIDWNIENGITDIPIEERSPDEVHLIQGLDHLGQINTVRISPIGAKARNPAFDVTPGHMITGLITEKGVCNANAASLSATFSKY